MKRSTFFAVLLDLLLFFIICALFEVCFGLEDVKIDRILPRWGGTGGAVKIIAYGNNFDVELDWTSNKPRTKMYLVSTTQEYECDFHQAESDEQQAVCYTRPMDKGYYWIRMRVADQWLEREQYCGKWWDHNWCRFQARDNTEPTIESLDRISSPPHQVITINGQIFTDIIASSNASASNGNTATLKRVWMTSGTCDLYRDVDDFYGLQLKENSNDGEIKCKITSSYVGNQNVSFIVEGEYGRSVTDMKAKYLSHDDRIYMIQTYATVEDVQPKVGSVMGGVRLKIKGKYFDDNSGVRAKVEVGGTDCKVESVTDDEIICVVDEKPVEERVFYPGGRGVNVEMLTSENITFNDTDSEGYLQFFFDSINVCVADHDLTYESRARGFFLPSTTSIHRFFFSSEDGTSCDTCKLYMDIGEGLELLTEKTEWSAEIILEKGKEYYYEVSVNMDGACGLPMKLNAYVAKTKFNSQQLGSVTESRQQLYTRSTIIHEIQMIETESWEEATAVNTQLNLTLSCELSCYGQRFRVSVSEMKTVWMERDERQSEVATNIQQLAVFTSDEQVKVIRTIVNENTTSYHVTIKSKRGDFFPYFKVETSATLEAELTSVVAGSPDYKTLTFEHDGILSNPISVNATEEEMSASILQMFEPKCPQELSRDNLKNKAFKFFDMEVDRTPTSATRSSDDSFCGTYSAFNLQTTFQNNDLPIRLNAYKHFCFAYLGEMKNFVRINYNFKEGLVTHTKDEAIVLNGMVPTLKWNYLCYNLDSILKSKYPSGRDFRITRLQFQRDGDIFVDDVFFGVSSPDTAQIQSYLDDRIPPAIEHIKLKRVEVEVNATIPISYKIELVSHDCAHNYPLFEFAFLGQRQDIADNATFYGNERNKSQIRVTRLSTASPPIGGTFDIYWEDDLLEPIYNVPANISHDDLRVLLENVEGIDLVRYYKWGECSGFNWIFNIVKPGGRGPKAMPNGTNLTGDSPTVNNYIHNIGGMKMEPIPGDFFRTAHTTPQVQVYINNVPSSCVGGFDGDNKTSCSFQWLESSTANVDLLQPTEGSESSTIILTGSGFDDVNITNNVVMIADVACSIISASTTVISCTVGKSPAGINQPVVVKVLGQGFARMANTTTKFTVNAAISSVSPSNGSQGGCNEITIAGTGFDSSVTSVEFGTSASCDIITVTYDEIICMTTSSTNAGVHDVIVTFASGENVTNPMGFEFITPASGDVTSVSTNSLRATGNENVTISGSGFGTSEGAVRIGGHLAEVTSWESDVITIKTPSLPAGEYQLNVHITGQGCALTSTTTTMRYKFSISSLTPTRGSIVGGTEITVQGEGLGPEVSVMIGESPCDVISVNESSLVCLTTPTTTTHRVDNMGSHPKYGIGYGWKPDILRINVGDEVNFRWATPEGVRNLNIGPFTCSDPISEEYDNDGFNVPPIPSGSFTYRFTESGTFYYKSISQPNSYQKIVMPGRVIVSERSEIISNISAMIGEHKATQTTQLTFTASKSDTPLIHGISPLVMDIHKTLEITAENMISTPSVHVGGKECSFTGDSTVNLLKCKVSVEKELAVGRHELKVNVPGIGNAMYTMKNLEERSVVFYPTLDNIAPTVGSLQGNTLLTIQGSGFSVSTRVLIGTFLECQVVEYSYTALKCWTPMYDASRSFQVTAVESGVQTNSTDAMTYSYSAESTPLVSNITVNSNNNIHYNLTVSGTGFGTNSSKVTVVVGAESSCLIDSDTFDDGQFFCRITEHLPLGENPILIHVAGKGSAEINSTTLTSVESKAEIFSVEPQFSSVQGGTQITITGNGFIEDSTIVKISGLECELKSVSLGAIICVTAPKSPSNPRVQVKVNNVNYPNLFNIRYSDEYTPVVDNISPSAAYGGQTIELEGSKFGNQSSSISITSSTSDESLCDVTTVNDTRITCTLASHEGGPVSLKVHVAGKGFAAVNAEFNYSLTIDSINPASGSFGGHQQVTINGQGFSNKSLVTIGGRECDMSSSTPTQIICYTPANNDTSDVKSAQVLVTNGAISSSKVTYNYLLNQTAVVNGVSPNRGGTGGGTVVTITGSNFRVAESQEPIVMIGGTACKLQTYNDTAIICETEPRPLGSIETQVEVFIGDYGIARQDDAYFYYIDRWSSIFTWGGSSIPTTKDFVIIPKGKTILLDTNTEVLIMLLIDGGKLIFDDTQDVSLHAENILLTNGGVLQVGTEEEPYQAHAEIVLYGQLRSPELPIFGAKTLAVRDGTLDLHGRHIPYTWSKLSETASKGSSQIKILHSVNWRVNDDIIIATTGHRHTQEQNEQRKIAAISDDGKTLTLDSPLEFEHLGIDESFGARTVEFRAEVGLLSRNIVIRGSNDPQWQDEIERCEEGFDTGEFATQTCFQGRFGEEVGSDQFGGSIMIHAKVASSFKAIARIEYTELTYMGQAFRLGRYPIHWHLMGDVTGMYVRGCSLHKTFNRAVAIHGTDNLLVDRNVIYDIMGGAFFIEDGIETGIILQYNLAVFVRQSTSLLNDDVTPAAYWVTNPNNTVIHNHAAGGTHFGFWYRMHEHPDGPSFTEDVCQQKVELGRFANNTVHSQGWFGLWIFQTYTPVEGGQCDGTVPSPARFHSLTTWNSEKGAEWVECSAMQFHDFVMVNNEKTGIDTKFVIGSGYGYDRGAMIKGALIVGHSAISSATFQTPVGITLPFAPGLTVEDVEFHNFDRASSTGFRVTTIDGTCSVLCGGFYYIMKGLTFHAVSRKMKWRWEHEGVLEDQDGTLTGSANHRVVPISGLVNSSSCQIMDGDMFSGGAIKSLLCPPSVRFHRLALNGISPSSLATKDMKITNQHGETTVKYAKKRLTHKAGWMALLYGGETHKVEWKESEKFTNISYNSRIYDLFEDDFLYIRHSLAATPDVVEIGDEKGEVGDSTPLTSSSSNLQWYFNPSDKNLDYIVANRETSSSRRKRGATNMFVVEEGILHVDASPKIYRCMNAGCVPDLDGDMVPPARETPDDAFTWSSLEFETSDSRKKRSTSGHPCVIVNSDSTVEILKSAEGFELCWCLIDIPTINISHLIVKGVVQFSNDVTFSSYHFSALTIQVLGGRIIAGHAPEDPFTKQLTINLKGEMGDGNEVNLEGVTLGTKALGCFGGCDFHGISHNVYWTHLSETVEAGSSTLKLTEEVDWKIGDEIVVTTTSYSSNHTEKMVIAGVSGNQLTVETPLQYRHLGKTYTVNNITFEMRAEVGLLSRNIKIQGEIYDEIDKDAFGARVLVGYLPSEDTYGWARISNVEFIRGGQEGFTDVYDPRFALVWLNTGLVVPARPSFVQSSSFHHCYSTGIGVFGANGIQIKQNIVHRPIHDGIRIGGTNILVEKNLVAKAMFRGSYWDRFEDRNFIDWHASFMLTEGRNITLIDNVAAGSERLCFHTDGVDCSDTSLHTWRGNVAHGCLHGVHMFPGSSALTCALIQNFVIYKSWDFGLYHQTMSSVTIKNVVIADSQVGYIPIIIEPPSLSHQFVNKVAKIEGMLLVGRSDDYDENIDTMDEDNDKSLVIRRIAGMSSKKPPPSTKNGKIGILLPMFASGKTGAPDKSWIGNTNYPAIRGLLDMSDVTFYNFKATTNGNRDLVFQTNSENEDAYVPTYVNGAKLVEVDTESLVVYERPSIGKINPSDCVDMECDGMKNVLIKDLDGGLLGAPGAIIPDAAFGWDDDSKKQRGLGDYRIPKTLLTERDGSRIEVESIIDHRGIVGTNDCTYNDDWQAYNCNGDSSLDYAMMVIESMDSDTETRRLSPVALMSDKYIDLENGPQDHGWCAGYTCQKRLSTFFTVVAASTHYDIYFTGYPPLDLRIHFLNVDQTKTIRLGIFYPKPERLDIYNGDVYIHPLNQEMDDNGKMITKPPSPENPDEYKPSINASIHGSNYMDRRNDILYLTIRGPDPIDIKTAPAVIVKFGFPATAVDDFFEENLIANLASYLEVPPHKIKIVDIIRETSRKRRSIHKRSTEEMVTFVFEFDDGIVEDEIESTDGGNTTTTTTDKALLAEIINNKTDAMIKDFQTGVLATKLNVSSIQLEATVATMELPPKFVNETEEVQTKILLPNKQNLTIISTSFDELSELLESSLNLVDTSGSAVLRLGGTWKAQIVLIPQSGVEAKLLGTPTVDFKDGAAMFKGLGISNPGNHIIQFKVVEPLTIAIPPVNVTVQVLPRQVRALFRDQLKQTLKSKLSSLKFDVRISDKNGGNLSYIGYKGNQWKSRVELAELDSASNASVTGKTEFLFDNTTGETDTDGLMISNSKDYYRYMFKIVVFSDPPIYAPSTLFTPTIQVYSPNNTLHLNVSVERTYKMSFGGKVKESERRRRRSLTDELSSVEAEEAFAASFNNYLVDIVDSSYVSSVDATENDATTDVEFTVGSRDNETADATEVSLEKRLAEEEFVFEGRSFTASDPSCFLEIGGVCKATGDEGTDGGSDIESVVTNNGNTGNKEKKNTKRKEANEQANEQLGVRTADTDEGSDEDEALESWHIALMAVAGFMVFSAIGIALFINSKRQTGKFRVNAGITPPALNSIQEEEEDESRQKFNKEERLSRIEEIKSQMKRSEIDAALNRACETTTQSGVSVAATEHMHSGVDVEVCHTSSGNGFLPEEVSDLQQRGSYWDFKNRSEMEVRQANASQKEDGNEESEDRT